QVLQNVTPSRKLEAKPQSRRPSIFQWIGRRLARIWMFLTKRPIVFVTVTAVLAVAAVFVIPVLVPDHPALASKGELSQAALLTILGIVGIVCATLFLHMAGYFRH